MDTQNLSAFVAVAESRSFSRAAEQLHLSQPAVSKRIAALEAQLGKALFDRVGHKVLPTDAGTALLPYAHRVLQEMEDGERALAQLSDRVAGRLSIGTSHHIGLHRLPPVLKQFVRSFPDVDLDIHFMDSEVACQAVLAGQLELGIVTLPSEAIGFLKTSPIWPDPLVVVASSDHVLAQRRTVRLADLAEYAAVLPDESTYTYRIVRAALQAHGLAPRVRLATNYMETLKMLAATGLGWSVLPQTMVDSSLAILRVAGLSMTRTLGAVWHERRTRSGAASALLDSLQKESR